MADLEVQNNYPKVICEKCSMQMNVIGIGSASGRLHYQCRKCSATCWGKNLAAMQLGSLGGKARASKLPPERRLEIAEKAGNAFAEKMRKRQRNQRTK